MFGVKEWYIPDGDLSRAELRTMPMTSLGQGKFSAADKCARLLHTVFLEGGVTEAKIRKWIL